MFWSPGLDSQTAKTKNILMVILVPHDVGFPLNTMVPDALLDTPQRRPWDVKQRACWKASRAYMVVVMRGGDQQGGGVEGSLALAGVLQRD